MWWQRSTLLRRIFFGTRGNWLSFLARTKLPDPPAISSPTLSAKMRSSSQAQSRWLAPATDVRVPDDVQCERQFVTVRRIAAELSQHGSLLGLKRGRSHPSFPGHYMTPDLLA